MQTSATEQSGRRLQLIDWSWYASCADWKLVYIYIAQLAGQVLSSWRSTFVSTGAVCQLCRPRLVRSCADLQRVCHLGSLRDGLQLSRPNLVLQLSLRTGQQLCGLQSGLSALQPGSWAAARRLTFLSAVQ